MMIESNVIHAAFENHVKRLLFLGSTCIYPKCVDQPMRESAILTDVLEPTNEPYALAKIAGISFANHIIDSTAQIFAQSCQRIYTVLMITFIQKIHMSFQHY